MRENGAGTWVAPLGVGVVVLVILVVVAVTLGRDEDPGAQPAGSDTSAAAQTTGSATSPTASPTPSPSAAAPEGADITGPARQAMKDDFPAMVPATVPAGWVTTEATYTRGKGGRGPVWRLEFAVPGGGEVVLTQTEQHLAQAVARYLGPDAQDAGRVDLRDYGTGWWAAYTVGATAGIGKQLPNTSVVIGAPTQADAVTLAEQLLTAEDADLPEAG